MIVKRLIRTLIMAVVSLGIGVLAGPFLTPLIESTFHVASSNVFPFVYGAASVLGIVVVALLLIAAVRGVFWTDEANTIAKLLASRAAMVALLFNVMLGILLAVVGLGSPLVVYILAFAAGSCIPLILPDWFLKPKG